MSLGDASKSKSQRWPGSLCGFPLKVMTALGCEQKEINPGQDARLSHNTKEAC
jgi:hypothetical protein